MVLRPYQIAAKEAVFKLLYDSKSTLVEMATGLGKTVLFGFVAHEWPARVLVIAHRDELIRQAAEKIQAITGENVAVEMGRERADESLYGCKVTVASVQTLARAERRQRFHPQHFGLIIIDEGHHAGAITYREVLDYFPYANRLFVTATALRSDKVTMESVYETVAYQYGIEPAIDDAWLVPVRQTVVKVEGLDFSRARTVAEDFNQADLEKILTEEEPLHRMCASAFELIGNRQALWFCASVKQAKLMAGVMERYTTTDNVCFLSGDTPKDDRRLAVDDYKKGRIQHLFNCALFLEGFDAPTTSAIVMARPTKSLGLYIQVLGRGTRPLTGTVDGIETVEARKASIAQSKKPNMLVIDYAGNAGRHKIITAADVLGGTNKLPVRDYAKETVESEGFEVDVKEAMERARLELELIEEQNQRRKQIVGKAVYEAHDVNPFVKQYAGKQDKAPRYPGEPCSHKQAGYICHLSRENGGSWTFEKAKLLTSQQARGVIAKLVRGGK